MILMPPLRDYQEAVLEQITDVLFSKGGGSACLQMATGSGKTVVAGALSRRLAPEVCNSTSREHILYLTHRSELVRQVHKTLVDFDLGDQIGFIQSGRATIPYKPLQIGSIPTVTRRLDKLNWLRPILIIVDEAHHIRAETWERILKYFAGVPVLGMTATPARLDGKGLGEHFETLIEGPPISSLIRDGHLCDLDIFCPPVGTDFSNIKKQMGDYSKSDGGLRITRQVIANTIDNFERYASHCRTLHYAFTIAHSEKFVREMCARGYRAKHVDGNTPRNIRDQIFKGFESGAVQTVSNVDIATEGVDFPACQCVILGRKTKSQTVFLQMVGRVFRPKADGSNGILLDCADCVSELGDPREDREWSLADGIIKRDKRNGDRLAGGYASGEAPEHHIPHEVDVDLVKGNKPFKVHGRTLLNEIYENRHDANALNKIAVKYALTGDKLEHLKNKMMF